MRISIITIKGNNNTTPRGIDIFEFPFNRILRRKKANRGDIRSCCFDSVSIPGTFSRPSEEGSLLARLWNRPISKGYRKSRRQILMRERAGGFDVL